MHSENFDSLDFLLDNSGFLKELASLRAGENAITALGEPIRQLAAEEIAGLERQGNRSADWARIRVSGDFRISSIFDTVFGGDCVIFGSDNSKRIEYSGMRLACGIYRSTIVDSIVMPDCAIHNAAYISNCHIGRGCAIINCATLCASPRTHFGNGQPITVGNETGGREIACLADLTPVLAAQLARKENKELTERYDRVCAEYSERCAYSRTVIAAHCVLRNCTLIEDAFIGEGAVIDGVNAIQNCTILSKRAEISVISHGTVLRDSCIQWGCEITTMAIVEKSLVCEHSHVERHAKVISSVVGHCCAIAEGELNSSLVGPFVGFHHQALLIAALWPQGRGNIAYGANVGSNHTGRAPDQEIVCGEGLFFGLGVNVKFPANYSMSPYTVIATGVDTLPQKVEYPFSLINRPAKLPEDVPCAYNEIFPGWMLSENIYALLRNEAKFELRNKATRSSFDYRIFKPQTVDLMICARERLNSLARPRDHYTSEQIQGLGKNYMTEKSRIAAIDSYSLYIEYYVLNSLFQRCEKIIQAGEKDIESHAYDEDENFAHARSVFFAEGYDKRDLKKNLQRFEYILNHIADSTFKAKERDDRRGSAIIEDYVAVNVQAIDDDFVNETMKKTAAAVCRVGKIKNLLA